MENNILFTFTTEYLKVGQVVYISGNTDDDDLNEYTEKYGDQITITEVEEDGDELTGNFWGTNSKGEDVPYHLEWRDVYAVENK